MVRYNKSVIVSAYQMVPLLLAWQENQTTAATSTDLGVTPTEASLSDAGAQIGDELLPWTLVQEIAESDTGCFIVNEGKPTPIREFSPTTKRYYSLCATAGAPTMLVSGIPMHRIKGIDPLGAIQVMAHAGAPLVGDVLDTATGLGYLAMEAAKTCRRVVTIELDPAAQEMARQSPWSRGLFENPRVERRFADSADEIQTFPRDSFSVILHDPPTMSLGGQLYSGEFYGHCFRVLKRGGRMFHYIGDPESRTGASTTRGVVRRLKEAGFVKVVPHPEAFGVTAFKER